MLCDDCAQYGWLMRLSTVEIGSKHCSNPHKPLSFRPRKYPKNITASHFTPQSPLFDPQDYFGVIMSDIGLVIATIGWVQ